MEHLFSPDDIAKLYGLGKLLFLVTARPLGLALIFTVFSWSHLNTGVLRVGFATAIGLPMLTGLMPQAGTFVNELPAHFALISLKEMFIGMMFGFIASLPFEALVAAGGVVDIYRGSGPGGAGPTGEATPYGQLFMVTGLSLFAMLGGFWLLVETLYASYEIWPLQSLLPPLTMEGGKAAFGFVNKVMLLAVAAAAPLLILMGASDLIFSISGKMGKNINITFLSATVKNLIALFVLPLFMMVMIRSLSGQVSNFTEVAPMMRLLFR